MKNTASSCGEPDDFERILNTAAKMLLTVFPIQELQEKTQMIAEDVRNGTILLEDGIDKLIKHAREEIDFYMEGNISLQKDLKL